MRLIALTAMACAVAAPSWAAPATPAANRANAAASGVPSVLVGAAGQSDSCTGVQSLGYGSPMIGATLVFQRVDKGCARIRKAKALQGLGYDAAAVQVLCGDGDVRRAMAAAGVPCELVKETR